MAGMRPGEFDEDFMIVKDEDRNRKAQPIWSNPQSCVIFEDSEEKATMWLVALAQQTIIQFKRVI